MLAHAQNNASMLDTAIAIEQLGADRADIRPDGVGDHLLQPAILDHIHVVVEHDQDVTCGRQHSGIIQGRVIEGPVHRDDTRMRGSLLQHLKKGLSPRHRCCHCR